ncbi:MAG TPA: MFS transporter, partial [Rhizomicrobium sp.]|nr:MFS transporter [Rhizomicrobium sp.]
MSEELAARVMRKVGWRILPFAMLLYFVSFIDRVNIGFAALTMNKDVGLSPAAFGLGAGIFFAGYFLFEVPSNLILHRVGARVWIARVMISWGIASGATAFVHGATGFYVLRFLLGLAEAGFFPGMILYFSYWFPASHRAAATSVFMAAAPLSTALGSPLSGALMQLHGWLGLKGWQWMFLIEAVPAVLLGIAVLFVLTSRPDNAAWLTQEERGWLVATLGREEQGETRRQSLW